MRPHPLALAALLPCACGDAGPAGDPTGSTGPAGTTGPVGALADLIEPMAWEPLAAADDPFAAHRPPAIDCPYGLGWFIEADGIELDTSACNYAGLVQPSLVPVARGAAIELGLYYFDLLAPEPTTAHLAVQIGDHVVFERTIDIPGKAAVLDTRLVADFDAPAGTPVIFHLHNHGQNNWTFHRLQVEVAAP